MKLTLKKMEENYILIKRVSLIKYAINGMFISQRYHTKNGVTNLHVSCVHALVLIVKLGIQQ